LRGTTRRIAVCGIGAGILFLGSAAMAGQFVIDDPPGDAPIAEFDLIQVRFGQFPPEVRGGRFWIQFRFAAPWTAETILQNFSAFAGADVGGREQIQVGLSFHDGQETQFYGLVERGRDLELEHEVVDGTLVLILPPRAKRDFAGGVEVLNVLSAVRPDESDEQMNDIVDGLPLVGTFSSVDALGFGPPPADEEEPAGEEEPEAVEEPAEEEPADVGSPIGSPLVDDGISPFACWGGGIGSGLLGLGAAYGVGRRWQDWPRGQRYLFRGLVGGVPPLAAGFTSAALGEPGFGLVIALPYAGMYGLAWGATKVWEPAQVIKKGFGWDGDGSLGQPSMPEGMAEAKPSAKKTPSKKTSAKKTPSKKTPSKKTSAKKTTKKATAKKASGKKSTRKRSGPPG